MDPINKRILSELHRNGRLTNTRLAEMLGISPATVAKRIDEMLSAKTFVMRAVPNPYRIGKNIHAFIALAVDLDKVKLISAELIDNPNISTLLTAFGKFNILLIVDFRSWESLVDCIRNDLSRIEGLNDIEIKLISEIKKRSYNIFSADEDGDSEPEQLDEIDQQLIDELQRDGKAPYAYLAEKTGTSSATISRRINSLIERNLIKIVAVPNPAKLGFNINCIIHLRARSNDVSDVCAALSAYPEVHTVMTLISNFDIIVGVHFPTSEMMQDFIVDKIAAVNGVLNIETYIRAEIKKILYSTDYLLGEL